MKKLLNKKLKRLSVEGFKKIEKIPLVVILDDVRSLLNVGSIFRTCDAFLVEKIYLCGFTGCPPHREINKTALGATETVDWSYCKDILGLITDLKQDGFQVISVEQVENSIMLDSYYPKEGYGLALVFGNEVAGVSQKVISVSDGAVEVPQFGTKRSLNVSVCAGVVLWDLFLKLQNT